MESLYWQQNADGLHVRVGGPDNNPFVFVIENAFINSLLAGTPPIYIVSVILNGSSDEQFFMLDLSKARPYIDRSNALKFSVGRRSVSSSAFSGQTVGRYSLQRGECYHERYFSPSGWKYQITYHDVFAQGSISAAPQMPQPPAYQPPVVETPVGSPSAAKNNDAGDDEEVLDLLD